jgi:UDP-N-acetylmuramoylalanine--D-glutamate ligase
MKNWAKVNMLIIGAARQGQALARHLAYRGANVILNDQQTPEKLASVQQEMAALHVKCVFGGHPLDVLDGIELVSLSGGIPLSNPLVVEAKKRGIRLTNDSQIFMEEVKAPVIAITGSAGKTTTTTLVGKMAVLSTRKPHEAWVGGNIGLPLVDHLDEIKPNDLVILEISSFQLEQMTISPHIAAILNITPNHLDRHGTLEAYTAAKIRILAFQKPDDIAILDREDTGSWNLRSKVKGKLITFGLKRPTKGLDGTYCENGKLFCIENGKVIELFSTLLIKLRGEHNLMNVLAACAIGRAAGFSVKALIKAVADFSGVSHRLEFVRFWNGATWYNDSIATAPERTSAAIRSFTEPLVLLLGGRDKNLPWDELTKLVQVRVDHVIVFGEASEKIVTALSVIPQSDRKFTLDRVVKMKDAIQKASIIVESGDVVLFSPGGTSFDEFKDFEERGEYYRQWVNQLP